MAYVISFVLSLILYLGGGWCFYNIYESVIPIDGADTLKDIACDQILIYAIWASVVIFFATYRGEKAGVSDHELDGIAMFAPITLWIIVKYFLPVSVGLVIINAVICIAAMTFSLGRWFDRI